MSWSGRSKTAPGNGTSISGTRTNSFIRVHSCAFVAETSASASASCNVLYFQESGMKHLALIAILVTGSLAQTPTAAAPSVADIMARVAAQQDRASDLRKDFTFHQKQLLRMNRGNGKIAREEKREYDVNPDRHGVKKDLTHFEGRYEYKGKYIPYDRPGYTYKEMDIDGELIDDLSKDLTDDGHSRDGISCDLFPLTGTQQHKYNFKLIGKENYRGRDVFRIAFEPKQIAFEPKPHQD